MDGKFWAQFFSAETITAFLTASGGGSLDQIGMGINPHSQIVNAYFQSFGTTPP